MWIQSLCTSTSNQKLQILKEMEPTYTLLSTHVDFRLQVILESLYRQLKALAR